MRFSEMRLNFLSLKRLHIQPKITHCPLQKNSRNHAKYCKLFDKNHLTLCVLGVLCGFEKFGLVKIRVYSWLFLTFFLCDLVALWL